MDKCIDYRGPSLACMYPNVVDREQDTLLLLSSAGAWGKQGMFGERSSLNNMSEYVCCTWPNPQRSQLGVLFCECISIFDPNLSLSLRFNKMSFSSVPTMTWVKPAV